MSSPDTGTLPRVSVIIPTWNGRDLLVHALEALERQTYRDFETVVVDNASTDGTAEILAERFPWVRLIALPRNVGFAAGVNAGIRATETEFVVLLNNDTEVELGWLGALVAAFERHPEVGICASKVLLFDDRSRLDSAGDQLGLVPSQIGNGEQDAPRFDVEREVLSACAAAAAYRRLVFEQVGLFDESFFAYMEDVDLGIRAQLAGFRCLFVPQARVYHHASATSARMPERKFHLLLRNSLLIFFRYMPFRRLVFAPAMFALPVAHAWAQGLPTRAALLVIRDVLRELPTVLADRRRIARERKVPSKRLTSLLAPPLTRQRQRRAQR